MPEWLIIIALTLMAGIAIPVGAVGAYFERIHPAWLESEFRHAVIAFGGGALLAAVALVLVPEGIKDLPMWGAGLSFAIGGLAFMQIDVFLARSETSASQLAAMLADFLPEALALGAMFATGSSGTAMFLAAIIALQNVPEGFNAFRETKSSSDISTRKLLTAFFALALLGPAAGLAGYFGLSPFPAAIGAVMLFAAGGILYLIFQDIAPQARLERHWAPPLGAIAGFLLGIVGHMLASG